MLSIDSLEDAARGGDAQTGPVLGLRKTVEHADLEGGLRSAWKDGSDLTSL